VLDSDQIQSRVTRSTLRRFGLKGARRRDSGGDGFLVPILVVLIVVLAVPFTQSIYYSFTNYDGMRPHPDFVGFRNYVAVFRDPALAASLWFTVLYAVSTTVITTLLAIPLALALNRAFFGRNVARAVFFFPAIPSTAILGFVWAVILSPLSRGALNALLHWFNAGPIPWLSNSQLAQVSVIVVGVWTTTGWHALLYLAYLQSIPADYYEVATLDGANGLQKFLHITLPLLTPAVTVSTLLLLVGGMNVYALPMAMTKGGPGFATFTITQSIITQGISQGKYGQAAAVSIVFMMIVATLVLAQVYVSSRVGGDSR